MNTFDRIRDRMTHQEELWKREPSHVSRNVEVFATFGGVVKAFSTQLVTCKDCKHATMSTQGYCKYCDKLCVNDDGEPEMQVNFDADFFCGYAELRDDA